MSDLRQIDQNFALHATSIPGETAGMSASSSNGLFIADSGLSCDTFNIIHIADYKQLGPDTIEQAVNSFREKDLDFCLWINREQLSPYVRAQLTACGLAVQAEEIGMVLDLKEFTSTTEPRHDNIREVNSAQAMETYAQTLAANWSPPDPNVLAYFERTREQYLDENQRSCLYLYYHQDQPAATMELFATDQEVIGIYGLSTLGEFRGHGIGTALMTYGINQAKVQGYKKLVLQATEAGIGIYRRLGFREVTTYFEFA